MIDLLIKVGVSWIVLSGGYFLLMIIFDWIGGKHA